jgi:hypothetical protein
MSAAHTTLRYRIMGGRREEKAYSEHGATYFGLRVIDFSRTGICGGRPFMRRQIS